MSLAEEFFQVATEAASARGRISEPELKKKLSELQRVCNDAKQAWSGSNLGYHASVYYEGLAGKPAGVEFSPEWGIEERWPVNHPDPGWMPMNHQDVIDDIIARAGNVDLQEIEDVLSELGETFSKLKERAISLLTVAQRDGKDSFLDRKLDHIEKLFRTSSATIAKTLVIKSSMSRDSLAVTQGHRIAPHQSLIAVTLSAKALENALATLEASVREAALHLERIIQRKRKMTATGKKIFIGHGNAKDWLELQSYLMTRLHLSVDEFNSNSPAGIPTASRLEEMLDDAAFAFLVMTAEDERPDGRRNPRMNVVHEAGLFQGRLGFRKAIILLENDCEEFSNIFGLGQIRFPKGNIQSVFDKVRQTLEREGLVSET